VGLYSANTDPEPHWTKSSAPSRFHGRRFLSIRSKSSYITIQAENSTCDARRTTWEAPVGLYSANAHP
jgi:hypothetical protein